MLKTPDPIECHLGKRVCQRRRMLGMTQKQLAEQIGVRFQQVQKYESGVNRIPSSRLLSLATALKVSINYFFYNLEAHVSEDKDMFETLSKTELKLLKLFRKLPPKVRKTFLALLNSLTLDKSDV